VITQAATPAPAPTKADLAATGAASAPTPGIGSSQPNVSAAAAPDAKLASSPSTAFSPNTAITWVSSTIRSGTAQLDDSSHAGSIRRAVREGDSNGRDRRGEQPPERQPGPRG